MKSHPFLLLHILTLIYSWKSIAQDAQEKGEIYFMRRTGERGNLLHKTHGRKDIIAEFEPRCCFGVWISKEPRHMYKTCVHCIHMYHVFYNALVHVIYSRVSGQCFHEIQAHTFILVHQNKLVQVATNWKHLHVVIQSMQNKPFLCPWLVKTYIFVQ